MILLRQRVLLAETIFTGYAAIQFGLVNNRRIQGSQCSSPLSPGCSTIETLELTNIGCQECVRRSRRIFIARLINADDLFRSWVRRWQPGYYQASINGSAAFDPCRCSSKDIQSQRLPYNGLTCSKPAIAAGLRRARLRERRKIRFLSRSPSQTISTISDMRATERAISSRVFAFQVRRYPVYRSAPRGPNQQNLQ